MLALCIVPCDKHVGGCPAGQCCAALLQAQGLRRGGMQVSLRCSCSLLCLAVLERFADLLHPASLVGAPCDLLCCWQAFAVSAVHCVEHVRACSLAVLAAAALLPAPLAVFTATTPGLCVDDGMLLCTVCCSSSQLIHLQDRLLLHSCNLLH